ncbi:hypothetical protein AQI84_28720 [Streptomyces griseorubiginosus]|nr:hypothetical protein AQI84_28720 [Streptomyces griseorubiginosus]
MRGESTNGRTGPEAVRLVSGTGGVASGRVLGLGGVAGPPDGVVRAPAAADGEPVRPSPVSLPPGTGRIRKVVSEAASAGAPGRAGGTEGREVGRGGTAPGTVGSAPREGAPGPDSGGIGPGPDVRAPVEREAGRPAPAPGGGGVSGKRAEAGGGGGALSENETPGFGEPGR